MKTKRQDCASNAWSVAGRSQRSAFTLTELLVVVAIMVVIAAIAVPSITGLARGGGLDASVANLRSTISLARQWAITHREPTYIVIQTNRVAYNVFTAAEGLISDWKAFPPGYLAIEFENVDTLTGVHASVDGMWGFAFKPDGTLSGSTNLRRVTIGEGFMTGTSLTVLPQSTSKRIEVYPLTGIVRVLEINPSP